MIMRKALICADLHLGGGESYGGLAADGLPVRYHDKLAILEKMIDAANTDVNIEYFIILGDVFANPRVSERIKQGFYQVVSEFNGRIIVVAGNHDWISEGNHAFCAIEPLLKNYGLEDKLVVVADDKRDDILPNVLFVPWLVSDSLLEFENTLFSAYYPDLVIMGHLGIADSDVGKFDSTSLGDIRLPDCTLAILGHYHKYQIKKRPDSSRLEGEGDVVWIYVGSPFRNNFGEIDYETGYLVYDFHEKKWERKLTEDRRFVRKIVDCDNLGDGLIDLMGIFAADVVKIVLQGSKEAILSLDKNFIRKKLLEDMGVLSVTFEHDYIEKEKRVLVSVEQGFNLPNLFAEFCKDKELPKGFVDDAVERLSQ